jgi:hypothetical protein
MIRPVVDPEIVRDVSLVPWLVAASHLPWLPLPGRRAVIAGLKRETKWRDAALRADFQRALRTSSSLLKKVADIADR